METRKGSTSTLRICIFLWFLLSLSRHLSAFSVTVNDMECVYEHVHHEGDTVSGNFVVVDHEIFWSSDHPGIDFEVTTPGGNVIRSLKGTSRDKFEFKAPKRGTYKFCFHNYYSTPEIVSFYIHIGHIPSEQDLAKDGDGELQWREFVPEKRKRVRSTATLSAISREDADRIEKEAASLVS